MFYVGIIAIALPITVIGANFGREYFALLEEEEAEKKEKLLHVEKKEEQDEENKQAETGMHTDRVVAPASVFVHNPSSPRSSAPSKQGSFNQEHAVV